MSNTAITNFVVAYDFSETSEHAIDRAIRAALRTGTLLHFVAALDAKKGIGDDDVDNVDYQYAEKVQGRVKDAVEARLKAIEPEGTIHFFVHARIGDAANEILQAAAELGADLIFVGSHGRTGIKRALLGSVSEHVVREAKCPVMVVRPKGYSDVTLQKIIETPADAHGKPYTPPHRYSYESKMVQTRPPEWPLN